MDGKLVCRCVGQLLGGIVGGVVGRHGVVGTHDGERFRPCWTRISAGGAEGDIFEGVRLGRACRVGVENGRVKKLGRLLITTAGAARAAAVGEQVGLVRPKSVTNALLALPVGKAAGEKRGNAVGGIGSRMPSRLPLRTCTSLRRSRHILVPMSVLGHAPAVGIPARFERARGRCTCSRPARLQGGVGGGRRRWLRLASMLPLSGRARCG